MRILGISGSPRRGGNSDAALRRCLKGLAGLGPTTFLRIHDQNIRHCAGCRRCMKLLRCAIKGDDFEAVLRQWTRADVLILAAPVYWLGPPGALKDFIDRTHGLYGRPGRPFAGKRAAVISVAADSGFDTHEAILTTWLTHYGAEIVGSVRLIACEKGDLLGSPAELTRLDRFVADIRADLARGGLCPPRR